MPTIDQVWTPGTWGADVWTDGVWGNVAGAVEVRAERAWAFTHHGHIFYVLSAQDAKTFICDIITGQWCRWYTEDNPFWNMFLGIQWKGRTIAADRTLAKIWEIDPNSELDEEAIPIARAVTGFMPVRGDDAIRQGAMRLTASNGAPTEDPATVQLRFSDDGGKSWVGPYTVTLEAANYAQRLEWRSLGRLRSPGRLWEITDVGGVVRIEDADSDLEGD
jgi:hypothetical protein